MIEHVFDIDAIAAEDRTGWSAAARSERVLSSAHVVAAARAARHFEDIYAQHEDVVDRWRSIAENVVERAPKEHRFDRTPPSHLASA